MISLLRADWNPSFADMFFFLQSLVGGEYAQKPGLHSRTFQFRDLAGWQVQASPVPTHSSPRALRRNCLAFSEKAASVLWFPPLSNETLGFDMVWLWFPLSAPKGNYVVALKLHPCQSDSWYLVLTHPCGSHWTSLNTHTYIYIHNSGCTLCTSPPSLQIVSWCYSCWHLDKANRSSGSQLIWQQIAHPPQDIQFPPWWSWPSPASQWHVRSLPRLWWLGPCLDSLEHGTWCLKIVPLASWKQLRWQSSPALINSY